jgi:hypothetical protein
MSDKRKDVVTLKGGVAHLPAEFREVAVLANQAGLAGLELVDVEYGIDVDEARLLLADPNAQWIDLQPRVMMIYRPRPVLRPPTDAEWQQARRKEGVSGKET